MVKTGTGFEVATGRILVYSCVVLTEVVARSGVVMLFVGGVHAGVDADLENGKFV